MLRTKAYVFTPTLLKKSLLPEPLCHSRITAATTEGFGCDMATKALEHILCSL